MDSHNTGIGYLSKRNDGMTELRINGFGQAKNILHDLIPFIRFKKVQARALYKAADLLDRRSKNLTKSELLSLIRCIIIIQENNYATKHKKTKDELMKIFDLTP